MPPPHHTHLFTVTTPVMCQPQQTLSSFQIRHSDSLDLKWIAPHSPPDGTAECDRSLKMMPSLHTATSGFAAVRCLLFLCGCTVAHDKQGRQAYSSSQGDEEATATKEDRKRESMGYVIHHSFFSLLPCSPVSYRRMKHGHKEGQTQDGANRDPGLDD